MTFKLYPYQQEALEFIKSRKSSYISLPPGGGKTLTALEATKDLKHILIITPASLCLLWQDEIRKWYGNKPYIQVFSSSKSILATKAKYVIVSYDKMLKLDCYKQFKSWGYEAAIVDEAHALKNPHSKRTLALMGWQRRTQRILRRPLKHVILLSGTPMMQRPIELYSALRGLRAELLGKYTRYESFGIHFAKGYMKKGKWDFSGADNLQELAEMCKEFIFRVSREEVYQELPLLTQKIIRLNCAQKLVREEKKYDLGSILNNQHFIPFEAMAEIRHMMAKEKTPFVVEYVRDLIDSGEKVIIFCWHKAVINSLLEAYPQALRVDGSVPTSQRQNLSKEYNNGVYQVAVCQIKAASEGLSFHTANRVVFAEVSWNPSENEQAYKRAHRRGQENPVFIDYLVAEDSIDDHIMRKMLTKEKNLDIFYDELMTQQEEN